MNIIADSRTVYCNSDGCSLYNECIDLCFWDRNSSFITEDNYLTVCDECQNLFTELCKSKFFKYCIKNEKRVRVPFCPHPEYTIYETYEKYLRSDLWKMISITIKKDRNSKCEYCGSRRSLQIHHVTYEHVGEELLYLEDILLLCGRCHMKEHELL